MSTAKYQVMMVLLLAVSVLCCQAIGIYFPPGNGKRDILAHKVIARYKCTDLIKSNALRRTACIVQAISLRFTRGFPYNQDHSAIFYVIFT